jgi:hypothetical protein
LFCLTLVAVGLGFVHTEQWKKNQVIEPGRVHGDAKNACHGSMTVEAFAAKETLKVPSNFR